MWLSGRITGGHLLIVAWSAVAWVLMHEAWVRRGWLPSIVLGFWCGLGVYLDSMFVLTLAGIAFAALIAALVESFYGSRTARSEVSGKERRSWLARLAQALALVLAFFAGAAPRAIGQWLEPYDAYNEQFSWSLDAPLLAGHCRILLLDCLPRLVAGHRLPGLEADPDPALMGTGGPIQKSTTSREAFRWWTLLLTILALGFFAAALLALGATALNGQAIGPRIIATGMLAHGARGRRRLSGQPEHLQLGQLSVPGPALDTLGDRLRPGLAGRCPSRGTCTMGRSCPDTRIGGAVHLRCRSVVSSIGLGR